MATSKGTQGIRSRCTACKPDLTQPPATRVPHHHATSCSTQTPETRFDLHSTPCIAHYGPTCAWAMAGCGAMGAICLAALNCAASASDSSCVSYDGSKGALYALLFAG